MASRDIRDEKQGSTQVPTGSSSGGIPFNSPSPIQIQASEDLQRVLVEIVLDDFHKADSDRNDRDYGITDKGETLRFTEWFKRIKELYSGYRIPKTIPWKFCSNRSLRIATSILDMIHSRLFPAVWNEDLCRWRSQKAVDYPKIERISRLMDWWVRVWSPLRIFFDNWTKYTTAFGDSLTESSWEVEEIATNETIEIPVTDEQGQQLQNPDGTMSSIKQTKINRFEKSKSRFLTKDSVYFLKGARDEQKDPVIIKETFLYKKLEELERRGFCINVSDKLREKIHVAGVSGNISPEEAERLREIKLRNMPVEVIREYVHYDVDGAGFNESCLLLIAEEYKIYLSGIRMRDITKSGRRPLKFTKFDCYIDRPEEMDGEGLLHKVFELSNEIDAIFNQLTDAHTLAVLRPFFYDPSGDLDVEAIKLGPNKGIPVTDPQKNVYFPPMEIPTERLINSIRLVLEFIERLTAASEYVMGRESGIVGGSGTATRTQAIVQSAEIRFSLPSERLRAAAADILTQHLDLIQLNIPMGMEERIMGEKGIKLFHQGELSDEGLSGEFDAFLLPDPSMGSKQTERDMMGTIYSILMQNVIVGTDPQKIFYVTAQWLKAMGKDDDFIKGVLGAAPNPDDIDDPLDENTLMIQGDFARVVPQITENHLYHIQKHMDLERSPAFQEIAKTAPELTNQILEYNRNHIQQHMQMMQAMMALMKKVGGNSGAEQVNAGTGQGANRPAKENAGVGGMETVPGPMGEALNQMRRGKVQNSKGI